MCRRSFLLPFLVLLGASCIAFAGKPRYVAGSSYFDPAVKGAALTWAQGRFPITRTRAT